MEEGSWLCSNKERATESPEEDLQLGDANIFAVMEKQRQGDNTTSSNRASGRKACAEERG